MNLLIRMTAPRIEIKQVGSRDNPAASIQPLSTKMQKQEVEKIVDARIQLRDEMLSCPFCRGGSWSGSDEFWSEWKIKHHFHPQYETHLPNYKEICSHCGIEVGNPSDANCQCACGLETGSCRCGCHHQVSFTEAKQ